MWGLGLEQGPKAHALPRVGRWSEAWTQILGGTAPTDLEWIGSSWKGKGLEELGIRHILEFVALLLNLGPKAVVPEIGTRSQHVA